MKPIDFKAFRKANNMTQEEAAVYFGCDQSFISLIERGKSKVPDSFMSKIGVDVTTVDETVMKGKLIPFYDVDVAAGNGYEMDMAPVSRPTTLLEIGGLLIDSESALRVYGNSMTPNYPAGCVVGYKQHKESFIEPGAIYIIETLDNRYLKRLYYNASKNALRCVSDNHMVHDSGPMKGEFVYPDFEIPLVDICRLCRVTGVIKRNIL